MIEVDKKIVWHRLKSKRKLLGNKRAKSKQRSITCLENKRKNTGMYMQRHNPFFLLNGTKQA